MLSHVVEHIGGTRREGQVRMTNAVARALATHRHLAVQAGTGTGKSMAYLVPAIEHAQRTDSTVVVSTATIALQNQLVGRDLPRLVEALDGVVDRTPSFAIVKGRSNYVCLQRVGQAEADDAAQPSLDSGSPVELTELGAHMQRVRDFAQDSDTGDRDDLAPGVPDTVWRAVSVTAKECIGASRCPFGADCFAEKARAEASDVDVVVTNHAMLAIDALADANILPEHDVVIVDEAHELDARITAVATTELSAQALVLAANRAAKLDPAAKAADDLKGLADELADMLQLEQQGRLLELTDHVQDTLVGVRDTVMRLRDKIRSGAAPDESENDPERAAERQNLANHLLELHEGIVRMFDTLETPPDKTRDVLWLNNKTLKVAPLSVAGLLSDRLFSSNTVVLTSATLSVGGNFNALAAAWGLPKGTWDGLDAGTPFDPRKAGILYTPRHIPEPGRDGLAPATLDEIAGLIMAAGGRTLGLFASRRAAEQAAAEMRKRLPFDILCQGDDTIPALVKRFADNENTCLFGTLTLWQGVDVPGRSCSLVIIDKIPFPRPDDPLLQARKEAADAAGRNGFMEVAATHASLFMAQGAGRLLRSVDDRGVVAVLDKRLVEKRYGSFIRSSMPSFWPTHDPDVVTQALKRLVAQ
ncbi:ATP-dependent DNA helicase [Corynebacterium argentoratense]|uniref:ATP-dependent DNA helicase n=1 Tax=Corynebacterium argentoratense TaxID=42817 RepID=UPI001F38A711|nr:ATP-dependent DNA helicase [Corynebacterium argentoratense]MCF1693839.1 ATP-dependent DNA helicase [Corynebacterium argentoratense]MCF1735410.1 ATP-dependent DNA helicase [Corynebacterium argentoratense]